MNLKNPIVLAVLISMMIGDAAYAAEPSTLAPNALYAHFVNSTDALQSAEVSFTSITSVYDNEELDGDAIFYTGRIIAGSYKKPVASTTFYDSNLTATIEEGDAKKETAYEMKTVAVGNTTYIQFPYSRDKKLKGKWLEIPARLYEEVGGLIESEPLFDAAIMKSKDDDMQVLIDEFLAAARKNSLYVKLDPSVGDAIFEDDPDKEVPNSTRYVLGYSPNAIVPFYKQLKSALSPSLQQMTPLAVEGFERGLNNRAFVEYVQTHSFLTLWFDNTTKQPVRMLNISTIPPYGKRKTTILVTHDYKWSKHNSVGIIQKPASTIPFSEAQKLLDISVADDASGDAEKELVDALEYYKKAKKGDKAEAAFDLGRAYVRVSDYKSGRTYLLKAAKGFKKNSVDQFVAYALAELFGGNQTKANEYFEQGLKMHPDDDSILNWYGWSLLGVMNRTATTQNLPKALEINQKLVKNVVDDINLTNLYVTYIILNKTAEAEALKAKFDNFESGDIYVLIARAYHRMGNAAQAAKYKKLAADDGYILTPYDEAFFKMNFGK